MNSVLFDPYRGNPLISGLPPIASRSDTLKSLLHLPAIPQGIADIPVHIRMHYLMMLRQIHIPSHEEGKLSDTIDLLLRSGLHGRNPHDSDTWAMMCTGQPLVHPKPPAAAALVAGFSGTGKTAAIENILRKYPPWVLHDDFPMMSKPFKQVVWLSVEVPASGRSVDLATALMQQWDAVTGDDRFSLTLNKGGRRDGAALLKEWSTVARSQFLGLVHFDEIQNLFKSPTLARRRSSKTNGDKLELSLVEDACLKLFLNLNNTDRLPLLFSGTPDGVAALTKRLATTQRITTGGYHHFQHFATDGNLFYRHVFLPRLMKYQYVANPLPLDEKLAALLIELSGGLMRVLIALWVAAHRIAFERKSDDLLLDDFRDASDTLLAPLKPAIAALRSGDPKRAAEFEDMVQQDHQFWASFWTHS